MVSESRSRGPWTARPLLGGVMSKPTAIHYQPPDYHEGHFACSVNWANGITNRWTDDPTKVKCGNCERTEVWRKAMHGLSLLVNAHLACDLDPFRHINGKPVKHPHPLKGIILVDRVDG